MKIYRIKRKSLCMVCGRRLSNMNTLGTVQWQPSRVDDKGIVCLTCYRPMDKERPAKGPSCAGL